MTGVTWSHPWHPGLVSVPDTLTWFLSQQPDLVPTPSPDLVPVPDTLTWFPPRHPDLVPVPTPWFGSHLHNADLVRVPDILTWFPPYHPDLVPIPITLPWFMFQTPWLGLHPHHPDLLPVRTPWPGSHPITLTWFLSPISDLVPTLSPRSNSPPRHPDLVPVLDTLTWFPDNYGQINPLDGSPLNSILPVPKLEEFCTSMTTLPVMLTHSAVGNEKTLLQPGVVT